MPYSNDLKAKNVSDPIFNRGMVENSTGGMVFEVGPFSRLERFLILGNEGGTYYAGQRKLTLENANCVKDCLKLDPVLTVQMILQISDSGRAIKNDPAVFALALCAASGNAEAQAMAYAGLNTVCRIGTHLFQFVDAVDSLRGWGTGLRNAVANWYLSRSPDQLARQVTKYAQREGWSHRDVLRLCHANSPELNDIFQYVCQNETWAAREEWTVDILEAVEATKSANEKEIIGYINQYGLEREHIPTEFLNSPAVWEALLPNLRQTALIRNLGKLSSIGLLKPLSVSGKLVADKIANQDLLNKGRVHPFSILLALKTYQAGQGFRGSLRWSPDANVIQALDDAFYMAFDSIEPTGKNFMFGLDISGSMTSPINNTNISCRAASGCLAMTSVRTEPNTYTVGFSHSLIDLPLTKQMSLAQVEKTISGLPFGWTDVGLAIQHATQNRLEVDTFVIVTDNEVNRGQHNTVLLEEYRQKMGRDARCIIVGMTATDFTIADPKDPRQLDIAGFDASGPAAISEFSR